MVAGRQAGAVPRGRLAHQRRDRSADVPDGRAARQRPGDDRTGTIVEGDAVAAEVESHGELEDGRVYSNHYHVLVRLADGKIREVREYNDTQHAYVVWLAPRSIDT